MARIGNYEIPDEITAAGWYGGAKCACTGIMQLKFWHVNYKHYEMRFAPGLLSSGKCIKFRHYNVTTTKWFTPAELEAEMNKIKENQNG